MSKWNDRISEEEGSLNIRPPSGNTVHIIDEDSLSNPFVSEEKTLCNTLIDNQWVTGFTMDDFKKGKRCKKCEGRYINRIA